MKCINCGAELLERAKFCPKCGTKVERNPEPVPEPAPIPEPIPEPVPEPINKPAPVFNSNPLDMNDFWPEWRIEGEPIGRGSYGAVYRAVRDDSNLLTESAIKIISIPSNSSEIDSLRSEGLDIVGTRTYFKGIVDDFVTEIRLMETLKGIQNIVSVEDYKVIERSDTPGFYIYIRMELLTPFNTYICEKTLEESEIIKLGCDICSALELCDRRNIIHRDIKPENIFVNSFGHFKLGDFGIARKLENLSGGMSQKGTYNYMAPEVAHSDDYDSRVDTYSLGIVLYRLLNGNRLPFLETEEQTRNPNERKRAVDRRIDGETLPPPCNASPEMAKLVLRACSFAPEDRFESAAEMKKALQAVANGTAGGGEYSESDPGNGTIKVRKAPNPNKENKENNGKKPEINSFNDEPKNTKPKKKKGKIIAVSVLLFLLAAAIALSVLFFTSGAFGVYRSFNAEEYQEALETYGTDVDGSIFEELLLEQLLDGRVDKIVEDYQNGEMTYEHAAEALDALAKMRFTQAKKELSRISSEKEERDKTESARNEINGYLAKGDEYFRQGDYANAIAEYSKVPEGDEMFETAKGKINETCLKHIDSAIARINDYKARGQFKDAVEYAQSSYAILPEGTDTAKLDTAKNESIAAYKADIVDQVNALVAQSSYEEAFGVMDSAVSFDSDTYLDTLRKNTENSYVESVKTAVRNYLNIEDYDSANRIVTAALGLLPGNRDLVNLKSTVDRLTPTYLLDVCEPYESYGFTEYVNGETFQMGGKKYTNGFTLSEYRWNDKYAIFNLGGNYSSFSFLFGHCDGTEMSSATVKIYCNGILTEEVIAYADSLPQKVTVNLQGVNQLKIVFVNGSNATYGFADVKVKQ